MFADGLVTCVGQAIGIIVADSRSLAKRAADLVVITYEELEPCLDIDDAIRMDRFHKYDHGKFYP